jgi:hypothetical protein
MCHRVFDSIFQPLLQFHLPQEKREKKSFSGRLRCDSIQTLNVEERQKLYVLIIGVSRVGARPELRREKRAQMRRRKCEVIKIDCTTPEGTPALRLEAEIQLKDFGIELKSRRPCEQRAKSRAEHKFAQMHSWRGPLASRDVLLMNAAEVSSRRTAFGTKSIKKRRKRRQRFREDLLTSGEG